MSVNANYWHIYALMEFPLLWNGLSYSNFSYEGLKLDKTSMTKEDTIRGSVTVYNDSKVPGKETVQLYMRDLLASTVRPVQQLIGFRKILLEPGKKRLLNSRLLSPCYGSGTSMESLFASQVRLN